ncbi:MAG: hypothetical protein PF486_08030 [Prolixibacteraceae bacterium]|jgi:hypothetical protein|nr:hypothetical protein [Prolixibacteraceae bacterium]
MKHTILALTIFLLAMPAMAQQVIKIDDYEQEKNNDDEIQTIFKRSNRDGFYGAISVGYSPIDNTDGMVFSSRGCWIMDRWFGIGLGGTGFVNNLNQIEDYLLENSFNDRSYLAGGYGGIVIEPILASRKPVHLSFPILLGGGAIAPVSDDTHTQPYSDIEDVYFVAEPGIELEVNFTKWLRIAAFATYRYTSDIDIENVSKDALRSYSAGLTFKVGLF